MPFLCLSSVILSEAKDLKTACGFSHQARRARRFFGKPQNDMRCTVILNEVKDLKTASAVFLIRLAVLADSSSLTLLRMTRGYIVILSEAKDLKTACGFSRRKGQAIKNLTHQREVFLFIFNPFTMLANLPLPRYLL